MPSLQIHSNLNTGTFRPRPQLRSIRTLNSSFTPAGFVDMQVPSVRSRKIVIMVSVCKISLCLVDMLANVFCINRKLYGRRLCGISGLRLLFGS